MQKIIELSKKEKRNVIGLMSGTSLDGVDAALVEITGSGTDTQINLIGFLEYPFPDGLKDFILNNSVKETSNVEDICRLNFLIPKIYTDAINELCKQVNVPITDIDLIGSHGQTIHHLPEAHDMFGYRVGSTLQIGDPSVLANLTGVVTVGDFRTADVALGGQGAPLVPYFDYLIFHSDDKNRALLNIGGISNITVLDKTKDTVLAFDCGVGNMLLDTLTKLFFNKDYDADGELAEAGDFNEDLFNALVVRDNFIERKPPKSTGREQYGDSFISPLLEEFEEVSKNDWLHTVAHFVAYTVYRNYEKFVKEETVIDELFISGGGAKNAFLLKCFKEEFGSEVEVKVIDEIGISPDAKEAICFAVLANETVSGHPSNKPESTGASRPAILGKICVP